VAGQIPTKGSTATGPKTVTPKKTPAKKTPGKAVAKVTPKKVDTGDFTPGQAKAHTERIAKAGGVLSELVLKAYNGRIWLSLGKGYKTWNDYLRGEFGGAPLQLPTAKAKVEALALAKGGMSTQAIADATGRSKAQTAKDVAAGKLAEQGQVSQNETPDPNVITIPESDITEVKDDEPVTVQGKDGKTYTPPTPAPKEPTVINIVSAARNIVKDLENVRIKLDALFSREDYDENRVDVSATLETAVGDMLDTLVEEFGDLVAERAPEPEPAV
jgi:hypothetical protein